MVGGIRGLSVVSFVKGTNPTHGGSPLMTSQRPHLLSITLGVRISTYNVAGDSNIQPVGAGLLVC